MVNTGLPSRDCETCRRRRVKCDLRRPGCLRCEKIHQKCSGYRDLGQLGIRFRVETVSSYPDKKKSKRSNNNDEGSDDSVTTTHRKSGNAKSGHRRKRLGNIAEITLLSASELSLSRGLVESVDMHVMPLIVEEFSFAKPGASSGRFYGSLECIPNLLRVADSDSSLYMACHAVSYAYLSNRSRSSSSLVSSHRNSYGKSLHALKLALEDPVLSKDDATLLTVWILCIYELVQGTAHDEGPLNWDIHSRALVGLLRARGRQQFENKTGCQLFQLVYHTIQIQALQTGLPPPPEALEWFDAIQPWVKPARLAFVPTYSYLDEVIRLCAQIKNLLHQDVSESDWLIDETYNIIQASNKLESSIKARFDGQVNDTSSSTMTAQVEWTTSRKKLLIFHNRNYIDAYFLCLHYSILELLLHITAQPDNNISTPAREDLVRLRQASIQHSRSLAERILLSLPSFLPAAGTQVAGQPSRSFISWADALRLMWPIRMIAISPVVFEKQRAESRSILLKLAYEVGIMQAVGTYYDTFTSHLVL